MPSKTPSAVYVLDQFKNNPIYEGFAFAKFAMDIPSLIGRDSLSDDLVADYKRSPDKLEWQVARLGKKWKPQKVIGRVAPFNDYPTVHFTPVFSKRACEALCDFLQPNGELLPLVSDVGDYFLYNITTAVDSLDRKKSKCDYWSDDPHHCVEVKHFVFHPTRLAGLSVFRIYELGGDVFVTDQFVERVQQTGLNGFNFLKVWPISPSVNWRMQNRATERAVRQQVAGHTLVLILMLTGSKPNPAEKKLFKRLEDELDAQLAVTSMDAPYFGCYQGHDVVDGELRMFTSCPDVDILETKLEPWLMTFDWPGRVYMIKRYGEIHDEDAREESYEIG